MSSSLEGVFAPCGFTREKPSVAPGPATWQGPQEIKKASPPTCKASLAAWIAVRLARVTGRRVMPALSVLTLKRPKRFAPDTIDRAGGSATEITLSRYSRCRHPVQVKGSYSGGPSTQARILGAPRQRQEKTPAKLPRPARRRRQRVSLTNYA
jgi:hypothetical protein